MLTSLLDKARRRLGPSARKRLRRLTDPMLSSVGSINGAQHSIHSVAMTFDDGPDASVTPRLLDLLARRGARATFFVLTDKATAQPGLTRRIIDEGHEVALHFDRHDRLTCLPLSVARQRLIAARQSLEQLAGKVTYFRPPFGSQTLATYVLARSLGLQVVAWGPYAEDWVEQEPAAAAERALHDLKGGDILLMHDGLETPVGDPLPTFDRVKMVELVLDGMQARGLAAMTVGGLLTTGKARRTAWFRH